MQTRSPAPSSVRIPEGRGARAARCGIDESPARPTPRAQSWPAHRAVRVSTGWSGAGTRPRARSLFVLFLPALTGGEARTFHVARHLEAIARIAMVAAGTPVTSAALAALSLRSCVFRLAAVSLRSVTPLRLRATRTIALRSIAPLRFGPTAAIALRAVAPLRFGPTGTIALRAVAPLRFGPTGTITLRAVAPLRFGPTGTIALRSIAPLR